MMLKNTFLFCLAFLSQLAVVAQQAGSLEEKTEEAETVFERGSRIIFQDDFEKGCH